MKKLTFAFLMLFVSATLSAQKDFQLGLQFSPTIGWIKPDVEGVEYSGTKIGFTGGLVGDFNISENYAFSTGLFITNTGGKLTNTYIDTLFGTEVRANQDIRLKYIEVPLTLKLKTNQIGYLTYFGKFGFNAGFNYDASADYSFDSDKDIPTNKNVQDVDINEQINLIRMALIVGLGAEYNLSGNTSFIMGVTFNNGFTNIFNDKKVSYENETGDEARAINNYFELNLGVIF